MLYKFTWKAALEYNSCDDDLMRDDLNELMFRLEYRKKHDILIKISTWLCRIMIEIQITIKKFQLHLIHSHQNINSHYLLLRDHNLFQVHHQKHVKVWIITCIATNRTSTIWISSRNAICSSSNVSFFLIAFYMRNNFCDKTCRAINSK